ncbi:sigma-70 family RNA polymerase sigma factor [Halobacillus litoralis]|uniref:sigma-70 family RNA polymerase sigma factor n=1 Tax=Halobacillus litoralis TaxID=45668 RepID=UPI001CD748DB|nr:sigma-70 family RNA polymerase sigma factor [Halobacillus litoralis]MCA0971533.1 sigma-70 family RNA polymerase sigma factor [Halobacillus litoralis]
MEDISFEECRPLIFHSLKNFHLSESDEDYIQEGYFIFDLCRQRHDPSRSKFTTYFVQQFNFYLKSHVRNEQRKKQAVQLLSEPHQEDPLEEPLLLLDLLTHHQLTPIEQEILHLSYKGYPSQIIADKKDLSLSTIQRARRRIKQKLFAHAV